MSDQALHVDSGLLGAARLLAKRYTVQIVALLLERPARLHELRKATAAPKGIIELRLRELQEAGAVTRETVYGSVTVYALTPKGEGLRPVIDALRAWGESLEPRMKPSY